MYWVDVQFGQRKRMKLYQTRLDAIILHQTLPACCIPNVVTVHPADRKNVLFGREDPKNSRTVRLVDGPPSSQSFVPVFVELEIKTKTQMKT